MLPQKPRPDLGLSEEYPSSALQNHTAQKFSKHPFHPLWVLFERSKDNSNTYWECQSLFPEMLWGVRRKNTQVSYEQWEERDLG